MSWTMSASGHSNAKEQEDALIEQMREAFSDAEGVSSAVMTTQYSGQVNLLDANAPVQNQPQNVTYASGVQVPPESGLEAREAQQAKEDRSGT